MPSFVVGDTYTWEAIAAPFGFQPNRFAVAGGMLPHPETNSLILVTNPEVVANFGYHDRPIDDGTGDFLYGGRGQEGDQELSGANRDVAENNRTLYLFERTVPRKMKYVGSPRCVSWFWDEGPDKNQAIRQVLRFRLRFSGAEGGEASELPDQVLEDYIAVEGARTIATHRRLERDRALTACAKARWRRLDPLLRCEVCEFSFTEEYGALGADYIEAHHRIPLGSLTGAIERRVSDLAPVCSNCHSMLHRPPGRSVEELRMELAQHRTARIE